METSTEASPAYGDAPLASGPNAVEAARVAAERAAADLAQAEAMLARAQPEAVAAAIELARIEDMIGQRRVAAAAVVRRGDDVRAALDCMRARIDGARSERDEAAAEAARLTALIERASNRRAQIERSANELIRAIEFAQDELAMLNEQVAHDRAAEDESTRLREEHYLRILALQEAEARTARELSVREQASADLLASAGDLQTALALAEQHFAAARLAHKQTRSRHQAALLLVAERRAAQQRANALLAQTQAGPGTPAAPTPHPVFRAVRSERSRLENRRA